MFHSLFGDSESRERNAELSAITEATGTAYGPTRGRYWIVAALFVTFLASLTPNLADLDIWHQMALAREALRSGQLPLIDRFAYTPTLPRSVQHEWGSGLIAYLLVTRFGGTSILLLKYGIAAGILLLCMLSAKNRGGGVREIGVLTLLAIPLLAPALRATIRAQAYSFLFFALLLFWIDKDRRGSRTWIFPWLLVSCLWVNLHAGVVVGIGILGVYWLEQLLNRQPHRHLLTLLLAVLLALDATPYGLEYYSYLRNALFMARPAITEWESVLQGGTLLMFAFAACLSLACACFIRDWRSPGFSVILVTALAGALHMRMLPFFAIACLCYLPGHLAMTPAWRWAERVTGNQRPLLVSGLLIVSLATGASACRQHFWEIVVPGPGAPISTTIYPVGAVDYLDRLEFKGNVMVPFELGAFVSWKLYPHVRVSVDSRYEVAYPEWLVARIGRFYDAAEDWKSTLAAYPTDLVLIPRTTLLADHFFQAGWTRIYTDRAFMLYANPVLSLPVVDRGDSILRGTFP